MKKENKNFLYNTIYQIFIFLIPFLTTPYISRVLGANNVGIYSYTYSIVYYFMLCSMIGINNYGAREIAKVSKDVFERSKKFWGIYYLQLFLTAIMLLLYLFMLIFFNFSYKNIMLVQLIFLVSVLFDVNWFFFGMEKFKITISRNIIIKILSMILIFLIVKDKNDLWKYTLIMSSSILLSQIYLFAHLRGNVIKVKIKLKDVFSHLKTCIILFIPVISYSIYRVMDKTMIGQFSNTFELGNYESAEKILTIPTSFITALGSVMLPSMSKESDDKNSKKIYDTFELCFLIIIPISFGLLAVSNKFSLLFFGSEFKKVGWLIKILIPSIIFSSIANVIRTSFLIPKSFDKIYVRSTIYGAIVNLFFNLIFIKKYGAYGACIGTIAAEFVVMIYQFFYTRKFINYKIVFESFKNYFEKSFVMFVFLIIIDILFKNNLLSLILQIIFGVIYYIIVNKKYLIHNFFGR